jgi:hypothetical protein
MQALSSKHQVSFTSKKKQSRSVKNEFISWLKEYRETFMDICSKCISALQEFYQDNPEMHRPFVNWIPGYGGLLRESENFSNEEKLQFMQRFHVPFELMQVPPTEEEQARLQPDDDDYVLPKDAVSGL